MTMKYTDKYIGEEELSVPMTIGIEFDCKIIDIDNKHIKLQISDTAGQERYRCIGSSYFRGSDGVMIVFDVNNTKTFEEIDYFFEEAK